MDTCEFLPGFNQILEIQFEALCAAFLFTTDTEKGKFNSYDILIT